jgi:sec-independent protein translocase protein TatB
MGNFTFSEIMTIVLVILIVFGPNRLPELARKTGEWLATARRAATTLREEFLTEYGEAIEPLKQARDEIRSTGEELRGDLKGIGDDLKAARDDVKAAGAEVVAPDPAKEPSAEGSNAGDGDGAPAPTDGADPEPPIEEPA